MSTVHILHKTAELFCCLVGVRNESVFILLDTVMIDLSFTQKWNQLISQEQISRELIFAKLTRLILGKTYA